MTDLNSMAATDVLARFQKRTLSPVEYLDVILDRIDAVEPAAGAVAFRFDERSRASAIEAERVYASATARPRALEGLPVAIKDDCAVAGDPCTFGSLVYKDRVSEHTAPIAERVLESGAIPHIRTRTSEFCLIGQCHSRMWGVTRNPWNPAFDVGGSSGGAAAGLISGMTPLATGSDVGGSIRIPASCCGVVGYKPPYGRVPLDSPGNLDTYLHNGPLARSVGDTALLMNEIMGRHPRDGSSLPRPDDIPLSGGSVAGKRIAVCETLGDYLVHPDMAANLRDLASRLEAAGAVVEYVELAWTRAEIIRAAGIHGAQYFGALMPVSLSKHRELLSDYLVAHLEAMEHVISVEAMRECLHLETKIQNELARAMTGFDAMLAPTLTMPALEAGVSYVTERIEIGGERITRREHVLALPFNICSRYPVMSVPSGFAASGIPTGIQIVGQPYDDHTVFDVAYAVEQVKPWSMAKPTFA